MPDILQIINDYIVDKVRNSSKDTFSLRLPSDLITHVAKFYITPYLAEPEIRLEGSSLKISGFNVIKVEIEIKLEGIYWAEDSKILKFSLRAPELVAKFLEGPLVSFEQKSHGVFKLLKDGFEIDIEKVFNLNPKWSSATYSSRNLVKLECVNMNQNVIELVFKKVKP
ncbi:MAG: hypothetical protein ABIM31_01915 [candidate division WOR-3 bacterium]